MSSSIKVENTKKDILILGKGPAPGLEHKLSSEKMYSINFAENNKKFCFTEPISEFKGGIRYVQKGHPTLATLVDLILQPRKFKVFLAIGLNRLSGLQIPL